MNQLTLRGFDAELERRIRDLAKREGISLNQAALRLLRKGAGLTRPEKGESNETIGHALDAVIGTWNEEEALEFKEAVRDFERVDDDQWQ